ncbi:MAG: gluconate kinase [Bifidobacterium sp.]|jgi:xylulokinase|nr:gluconate kinase [Bifidobacterium sp.]MCH4174569.1 gluconate kinase [Bifidobacterium sp.]
MAYIATFDVGTTAVKAVLVSLDVDVTTYKREPLSAQIDGVMSSVSVTLPASEHEMGHHEQNPDDWWRCFLEAWRTVLHEAGSHVSAQEVVGIILSGQMQDVIVLDAQGKPLRQAMLYSDGRAAHEAATLEERYGSQRFLDIVGNRCEGSLPLPKLMWIQQHEAEIYSNIAHVLFDAKDYIISRLTGKFVGDVTACSTVGAMNIHTRAWEDSLIATAGIDIALFPHLHVPSDVVGNVSQEVALSSAFISGTPVYAGIGDAGATTLASGVARSGQYNINIGTSGWIAGISNEAITDDLGVANLACTTPSGFINGVPFLNAGGIHGWATRVFAAADQSPHNSSNRATQQEYERMSHLLADSEPGSHGVLCLPYFVGERFPVMNADIRGAFVGIGMESNASDLARACLEGVAFSLRQGMERFESVADEITLIGGGARERVWCQIIADVLGHRIEVFDNAETMPAVALAYIVLWSHQQHNEVQTVELLSDASIDRMMQSLRAQTHSVMVEVDTQNVQVYDRAYERFCKLYPAVSSMQ